eukprot:TRINITY_DN6385_c0_g1_i1.p2 TRINITY_DN6385_c0_g1~~TRINITY_DN6385_c0_g1_i1.p2  ORF type:complete len:53 (+),score=8.57 TRINITY_DN6385_c0_g1_i1:255-413(+)
MCKKRISPTDCAQFQKKFYCKGCISKARDQSFSKSKSGLTPAKSVQKFQNLK